MERFSSRKFILCLLVVVAASVLRYFDKIEATHLAATFILISTAYIASTLAQTKFNKVDDSTNMFDRIAKLPFVMSVILVLATIALQALVKIDGTHFVAIVTAVVGAYVTSNVLGKTTLES